MADIPLYFSRVNITRSYFQTTHLCDASAGKYASSFGFIRRGSVEIEIAGERTPISEGSLFFLPDGLRYRSYWRGDENEEIEFYSIHLFLPDNAQSRFAFSVLMELSMPDTLEEFRQIYALSSGTECEKMAALSRVCDFLSRALPYLVPSREKPKNPVLLDAMRFIRENYADNFSVDDLAAFCHISPSRLYHLFRDGLGATPIGYRNDIRVEEAIRMLRVGNPSTEEILRATGFHSAIYFRETFRSVTGMSPRTYRRLLLSGESEK